MSIPYSSWVTWHFTSVCILYLTKKEPAGVGALSSIMLDFHAGCVDNGFKYLGFQRSILCLLHSPQKLPYPARTGTEEACF